MDAPDEFTLLAEWRAGDQRAGSQILRAYFAPLHRFFFNKVDVEADIDELIQDTLMACVAGVQRIRSGASFRSYLFSVAHNRLISHWQRRRHARAIDALRESVVDLGASPTQALAHREEHRVLLAALRRLPLEMQVLLEMHHWERLPGPELAQVLDLPEGTVRSRLRRANTLLRAAIVAVTGSELSATSTLNDLERWAAEIRAHTRGRPS